MSYPRPADDEARVAALRRLGMLDEPPAADLQALTRLAAYVSGAPMSVLNLIDADVQVSVAGTGLGEGLDLAQLPTVPREQAICAHTVGGDRELHVPDLSQDERFRDNPWVSGELGKLTLYYGMPLHDHEGFAIGSLCVIDPDERRLDEGQVAALRDIAEQAEQLIELRRQHHELLEVIAAIDHAATHDPLTGLLNRRVLVDRLEHAASRSSRSGIPPTVFFCDVDGFKSVNDTYGHEVGDATLVAVARHIESVVRPSDTVARLGGDEFIVICEDLAELHKDKVADRLRRVVVRVPGLEVAMRDVHLSVGALTAHVPSTAEEVLSAADRLMYVDKNARRARSAPAL